MPSCSEPIAFHCLINGIYEPEMIAIMRRFLPPGGTFVDIGANVGIFSVVASRQLHNAGKVIAIEASPEINCFLGENITANDCRNVVQVGIAVSDDGPRRVLFWPAPGRSFGMGAMAPQFGAQAIEVEADTIDNILVRLGVSHVDLLKIDVEGFEAAAFRGATALLTREPQPVVAFEFADWAEARAGFECGTAQQVLLSCGYSLFAIEPHGRLRPLSAPLEAGAANLLGIPVGER
jgi:FkbM family methyltransferase